MHRDLLLKNDNYLLVTHAKPDGDAWGSLMALHLWLENHGKSVVSLVTEDDLLSLEYMHPLLPMDKSSQELPRDWKKRKIICLDLAGLKRVGFPLACDAKVWMQFDHHADNEQYAEYNLVESKHCSTTELLFYTLEYRLDPISKPIANSLAVGLLTDTLFFSISKAQADTFYMAGELIKKGVDISKLNLQLQKELTQKEFTAINQILASAEFHHQGQLAVICVSQEFLGSLGINKMQTHNLLKFLRTISTTKIYLVLVQDQKTGFYKGSIRSDDPTIEINDIAAEFGGGGHRQAAGLIIEDELAAAKEHLIDLLGQKLALKLSLKG